MTWVVCVGGIGVNNLGVNTFHTLHFNRNPDFLNNGSLFICSIKILTFISLNSYGALEPTAYKCDFS